MYQLHKRSYNIGKKKRNSHSLLSRKYQRTERKVNKEIYRAHFWMHIVHMAKHSIEIGSTLEACSKTNNNNHFPFLFSLSLLSIPLRCFPKVFISEYEIFGPFEFIFFFSKKYSIVVAFTLVVVAVRSDAVSFLKVVFISTALAPIDTRYYNCTLFVWNAVYVIYWWR